MTIGYNPFDEDFSLEELREYRTMAFSLREEKLRLLKRIDELEEDKRQLLKRLDEEFVSLKAVKAAGNSPKAMKMLVESVGCVQKDTANEIYDFAKEFYSSNEDIFGERLKDFVKRYGVEVE